MSNSTAASSPSHDFRLGFKSQPQETQTDSLTVEGTVPQWLAGTLLRVTPGMYEIGDDRYRHWFDGLAMLFRFHVQNQNVSYTNRYVRSRDYVKGRKAGRIKYATFATMPDGSFWRDLKNVILPPRYGENANVNVMRLGDDYVARSEYPPAVCFAPDTLETLGARKPRKMSGQMATAHPHRDHKRNIDFNLRTKIGPRTTYRIFSIKEGSHATLLTKLPQRKPAYMHSFGMSERYLVLTENPLRLPGPMAPALGTKPYFENYEWMPHLGMRLLVIDKDTGELVADCETDPSFVFHHVNAFERDNELVVDVIAYDGPSYIHELYLDQITAPDGAISSYGELLRYRISLDGSSRVATESITDRTVGLPRFDYERLAGESYRYTYVAGARPGESPFYDRITRVDVTSGVTKTWHPDHLFVGEPVFARAPNAQSEDDGILLTIALDPEAGASAIVMLDARTMSEVARAWAPHHIPYGFHGQFFPELA